MSDEYAHVFCHVCGTILDPPEGYTLRCSFCSYSCKFQDVVKTTPEVCTVSKRRAKPAWVSEGKDEEGACGEAASKHATIEEPCPKCGHPEQFFYTMQLRSVDEGSTVFYECKNRLCNHKYSQNN